MELSNEPRLPGQQQRSSGAESLRKEFVVTQTHNVLQNG